MRAIFTIALFIVLVYNTSSQPNPRRTPPPLNSTEVPDAGGTSAKEAYIISNNSFVDARNFINAVDQKNAKEVIRYIYTYKGWALDNYRDEDLKTAIESNPFLQSLSAKTHPHAL